MIAFFNLFKDNQLAYITPHRILRDQAGVLNKVINTGSVKNLFRVTICNLQAVLLRLMIKFILHFELAVDNIFMIITLY